MDGSKFMPLYVAVASTSTGQPGLMLPVSTFRERMRCFLVVPPSGVIIASKKSAREPRSTMGGAGDAYRIKLGAYEIVCRYRLAHISCQITVPLPGSSAYTLFDSVATMIIALPLGPPSM